jgi:hypothetical protein
MFGSLIDFVPAEKRGEAIPCHHIPLNHRGDTVEALGGPGTDPKVEAANARLASQDDSAARRGIPITAASVRLTAAQTLPSALHCMGRNVPLCRFIEPLYPYL